LPQRQPVLSCGHVHGLLPQVQRPWHWHAVCPAFVGLQRQLPVLQRQQSQFSHVQTPDFCTQGQHWQHLLPDAAAAAVMVPRYRVCVWVAGAVCGAAGLDWARRTGCVNPSREAPVAHGLA
jgi:hypothetical protein